MEEWGKRDWVAAAIAEWYAPWELKKPLNEHLNRLYRAVGQEETCYRLVFEIDVVERIS